MMTPDYSTVRKFFRAGYTAHQRKNPIHDVFQHIQKNAQTLLQTFVRMTHGDFALIRTLK